MSKGLIRLAMDHLLSECVDGLEFGLVLLDEQLTGVILWAVGVIL